MRLQWGRVCFRIILMISCDLVCWDNTSVSEAGVLSPKPSQLLRENVISGGAHQKKKSSYLPLLTSSIQFREGPEKQSSWSCTTAPHYQYHLPTFVFVVSCPPLHLPSILSSFNCLSSFVSLFLCSLYLLLFHVLSQIFLPMSSSCSLLSYTVFFSSP